MPSVFLEVPRRITRVYRVRCRIARCEMGIPRAYQRPRAARPFNVEAQQNSKERRLDLSAPNLGSPILYPNLCYLCYLLFKSSSSSLSSVERTVEGQVKTQWSFRRKRRLQPLPNVDGCPACFWKYLAGSRVSTASDVGSRDVKWAFPVHTKDHGRPGHLTSKRNRIRRNADLTSPHQIWVRLFSTQIFATFATFYSNPLPLRFLLSNVPWRDRSKRSGPSDVSEGSSLCPTWTDAQRVFGSTSPDHACVPRPMSDRAM